MSGSESRIDQKMVIQIVNQQIDYKVGQILEQKLANLKMEIQANVQNDVSKFKQDIIMKINEINESIHKNNLNSRDQINQLEKNNREFVSRLSSQHQILMQEFENQKVLNKQSIVNIETKIAEFENFIRLQGSQANYSTQRRKSMNNKIQHEEQNSNNVNSDEKVMYLQSELDTQKAMLQEMQKNMKNVIKHSSSLNLNKKMSSTSQHSVEYKLDKNNFLIDSQGNFILNENGKVVQLNKDQIQLLKQSSVLK